MFFLKKSKKKIIGLALGSGGPRGLAHIGVIEALLQEKIPIDLVAGASAGALIGGLYCEANSITDVKKVALSINQADLLKLFSDFGSSSGIIKGNKIEQFLKELVGDERIDATKIPFVAVATDSGTGDPVRLTSGSLVEAIRASCSIPVLLSGCELEGKYLIDGGCSEPVPVTTAKQMGATDVIAVNLDVYPDLHRSPSEWAKLNAPDMGMLALEAIRYNLANEMCKQADITIVPDVADVSSVNLMDFFRGDEVIKKGYQATMAMIPEIQKMLAM